jgi:hypothetical protein
MAVVADSRPAGPDFGLDVMHVDPVPPREDQRAVEDVMHTAAAESPEALAKRLCDPLNFPPEVWDVPTDLGAFEPDLSAAFAFASLAHAGQKYGRENPYTVHLRGVFSQLNLLLARMNQKDSRLLAAAYLHDVLEDTEVKYDQLKQTFGTDIAELVYAVTDEVGRNRRERHNKTYPKIAAAGDRAVLLKIADRLANVLYSLQFKYPQKLEMYVGEYPGFRHALISKGPDLAWVELDNAMSAAAQALGVDFYDGMGLPARAPREGDKRPLPAVPQTLLVDQMPQLFIGATLGLVQPPPAAVVPRPNPDNVIPPITDPLGRHWNQPDRDEIQITDTRAYMTTATKNKLSFYDSTLPTGTYDGKMWGRCLDNGKVLLCWFAPDTDPTKILIRSREIEIDDGPHRGPEA